MALKQIDSLQTKQNTNNNNNNNNTKTTQSSSPETKVNNNTRNYMLGDSNLRNEFLKKQQQLRKTTNRPTIQYQQKLEFQQNNSDNFDSSHPSSNNIKVNLEYIYFINNFYKN